MPETAWLKSRLCDLYGPSGDSPTQVVDYLYDVENRWIGENIDSNGDGVIDHRNPFRLRW